MLNGNGKTISLVLSIVLGASSLVGGTIAIMKSVEAGRIAAVEAGLLENGKIDAALKLDYTEVKTAILEQLKTISRDLADVKQTLKELGR